jgi:hypothetical protein
MVIAPVNALAQVNTTVPVSLIVKAHPAPSLGDAAPSMQLMSSAAVVPWRWVAAGTVSVV